MRQRKISAHDLKRLAPPMPGAFEEKALRTLRQLPYQKEEPVVKKKLSVGLIFAIVLLLIALGAVAAVLLSGKEFVQQELVPKVIESVSDQWTHEEVDDILRIASENGIVLSDDVLLRLRQGDGTYKEELMRVFVKVDLGFYPATWPIEDQAWYDALLVECGLLDVQTRFVPEGDEISLDEALGIAIAHIKSSFGDTADFTDETAYRRFVEYRQMIPEGEALPLKWYIAYEALLPTLNSYHLTIATDGTIEESRCEPGIYSGAPVRYSWQVSDYYARTYGQYYWEWPQDIWMAMQRDLELVTEEKGNMARAVLLQQYGTPDAQSITMDQAVEAAINAMAEKGALTKAELEADYKANALYLIGANNPVWKISFAKPTPKDIRIVDIYHAEVNAYTGEVQNFAHDTLEEMTYWFDAYVLQETYEKLQIELDNMPSNG